MSRSALDPSDISSVGQSLSKSLRHLRELVSAPTCEEGANSGLKISIPFAHTPGWAAQQSLTRSILLSLQPLALKRGGTAELLVLNKVKEAPFTGVPRGMGVPLKSVQPECWWDATLRQRLLEATGCSVILNLYLPPIPPPAGVGLVGWIFDFQHIHLAHNFSAAEIAQRNQTFRQMAKQCDLVMLSSQDARQDFARFVPEFAHKARVHPFPSALVFQKLPQEDPRPRVSAYHVPAKFILVANQFWTHKNHGVVIDAISLCRQRGLDIPVVFTGLPNDGRTPSNSYVSSVLQRIARQNVSGLVLPLGLAPLDDLIALMRCATLIIQPSQFEGWSTIVEDAKALGRPVMCSNLPLHREQHPGALGFFDCDDPERLAALLQEHWNALPPGPDLGVEEGAMRQARAFSQAYGKGLLRTCREAEEIAQSRSKPSL